MNAEKNRLYSDVEFLTTLRPFRNVANPASLERVCTYLKEEFSSMGLEPEEQVWNARGSEYKNIIASYNKGAGKRLIVGAHYDVCGDQPGADDNASAVAGLLETARLIMQEQPSIDYRIDFVAYCLEEPPFFGTELMGSFIHASSLHDANVDVIGMICYEMIGYFSDEPGSQKMPRELALIREHGNKLKALSVLPRKAVQATLKKLGIDPSIAQMILKNKAHLSDIVNSLEMPDAGNFIIALGLPEQKKFTTRLHKLMSKGGRIDVKKVILPRNSGVSELSDHMNYWHFGYNAVMINDTTQYRNPHYHEVTDTIETLNFDKMKEVVNATYQAVIGF
jgi:hypothetical protein